MAPHSVTLGEDQRRTNRTVAKVAHESRISVGGQRYSVKTARKSAGEFASLLVPHSIGPLEDIRPVHRAAIVAYKGRVSVGGQRYSVSQEGILGCAAADQLGTLLAP